MRMLGEGGQGLTLFRCAGDARVIESGAGSHLPESFLPRFGGFALAQQYRQGPAQGVAEAVLVILRCPQAQFEQRRRQRRMLIEDGHGRFELFSRDVTVVSDLHQNANHLAPTEWHAYAHARL